MFVFPRRLVVGDVSVIHPAAASFAVGAARAPGFAAAARDASKRCAYRQVSSALPFVPMSVESFGRLGAPALTLLGDLADQAVQAGGPGLSRATFICGALRELSVKGAEEGKGTGGARGESMRGRKRTEVCCAKLTDG
jgi:hypothetical protein